MVEDDDEVGLDERGGRDADRVAVRQRHGRLEQRDGVVGEGTDGAAGEARHPVHRLDAAARDERSEGREGVGGLHGLDRQVRGEVGDRDRPGLDPGEAVADLEEAPRPDAQERVAARSARRPRRIRGGRPGPPSSRRRKAPMGVSRSAGRVARSRTVSALEASRLASARLIGSVVLIALSWTSGIKKRPVRPGTKGRAFRGATLIRRVPHSFVTDGDGTGPVRSALPGIAGALRRSLLEVSLVRSGGSRVHSLSLPHRVSTSHPALCADARRVLVPFITRIRLCGADGGSRGGRRQAPVGGSPSRPSGGRWSCGSKPGQATFGRTG